MGLVNIHVDAMLEINYQWLSLENIFSYVLFISNDRAVDYQ
jgi:hypothetical protein